MTPLETLRMNLRNSLQASGTSTNGFARLAGVDNRAVGQFLTRQYKKAPSRNFISKIEQAMMQKGWLNNFTVTPLLIKKKPSVKVPVVSDDLLIKAQISAAVAYDQRMTEREKNEALSWLYS